MRLSLKMDVLRKRLTPSLAVWDTKAPTCEFVVAGYHFGGKFASFTKANLVSPLNGK